MLLEHLLGETAAWGAWKRFEPATLVNWSHCWGFESPDQVKPTGKGRVNVDK